MSATEPAPVRPKGTRRLLLGVLRGFGGDKARPLASFGVLHAGNTALNMGFTLVQLLVLAHILPPARYSEIVFLTAIGFYLQPLDQALGKANFVALRASLSGDGPVQGRREVMASLAGQGLLLLLVAVATPCFLQPIGSGHWTQDMLFLAISLMTNYWSFDLQSTAWALDRRLPFVKLAIVYRLVQLTTLGLAYAQGSFPLFVIVAACATAIAITMAARLFATAGLFRVTQRSDWPDFARIFGVSLLATGTDLIVLNAPYALISVRFGIGPTLVLFDSVMKVARIAMAGARTLAEIALSRHGAMVAAGRLGQARRLFLMVVGVCVAATLVPAAAVAFAGQTVFRLLLGPNNVIPLDAMIPAAGIILTSALYQVSMFFLSFSNRRRPVQTLSLTALAALAVFSAVLFLTPLRPTAMLELFCVSFIGIAVLATLLTDRLFRLPKQRLTSPDTAALANATLAAEPSA